MLVYTSVPFFILNLIFIIKITMKLINARCYSDYKPRFDFFLALVWSYVPLSFFSALNDIFGHKLINNYLYCSTFAIADNLAWISFFAAPILSIYLFLLMFTEMKLETINKIGVISCILLLIIVFALGFTFSIFLETIKSKPDRNSNFTECSFSAERWVDYSLVFAYLSQGLVILFIFLILSYDRILKLKIKRKKLKINKKRINTVNGEQNINTKIKEEEEEISKSYKKIGKINMMKSFLLIVIFTVVLSLAEVVTKRLKFMPVLAYSILFDLMRLKPFIYSVIILMCDKSASILIDDYPIKRILEISELTQILEEFLNLKGDKKLKELFGRIKVAYSELENKKPNKKLSDQKLGHSNPYKNKYTQEINNFDNDNKDLEMLEKEILNHGFYEFYLYDGFISFLWKFQNVGILDMEIGNKKRSS